MVRRKMKRPPQGATTRVLHKQRGSYLRSGTLWTLQPGHDVARYQILRILERLDQPDIFLFLTFHLVAPFGCSFPFLHALLVATLFATRFSRLFHYPLLFLLCVFLSFFILRHILRFFLLRRLLVLLILSFAPFPHCVPSLCVSFAFQDSFNFLIVIF